jgi:hypothetical protein
MLDQVIIRPALGSRFKKDKLAILSDAEGQALLSPGGVPSRILSDHLPITFCIDLSTGLNI